MKVDEIIPGTTIHHREEKLLTNLDYLVSSTSVYVFI